MSSPNSSNKAVVRRNNNESSEECKLTFVQQLCWWLLGVGNNFSWVIAAASASEISGMAYGLTYLANSLPCLIICLIAPYTFYLIPYEVRMGATCFSYFFSMVLLALPMFLDIEKSTVMGIQLTGVALIAIQCQLGECTLLSYASTFGGKKSRRYLTLYASGTGMAGILGTVWPLVLETILGLPLSTTVLIGLVVPAIYTVIFFFFVERVPVVAIADDGNDNDGDSEDGSVMDKNSSKGLENGMPVNSSNTSAKDQSSVFCSSWGLENTRDQGWTLQKRVKTVAKLWRYILPLFTVYFAEYFIQSGLWSGIGVPTAYTAEGRSTFYHYAIIAYQVAVFISRSSGLVIKPNMAIIWALPIVQLCMVGLFAAVAVTQFWTGYTLLIPAFAVGLLGGASYCLTYVHISDNVPEDEREFSIATTTVAENLGLTLSSFTAIYAQGCVWSAIGIEGGVGCSR